MKKLFSNTIAPVKNTITGYSKKVILGMTVIGLAIGVSAFTNTSTNVIPLFWYETNATGTLLTSTNQILEADHPTNPPCTGDDDFCARGFTEEETVIVGLYREPNIPIKDGMGAQKAD